MYKVLARIELGISDPMPGCSFQISECNVSTDLTVVVTGPSCFRYLRINDGMNGFKNIHNKLIAKDKN